MGNCNNTCINLIRKKKEFNLEDLEDNTTQTKPNTNLEINDPEILSRYNLI
jgi:hypothetical protein